MLEKKSAGLEFLDRFTEEIILNIRKELNEKEKILRAQERIKKEEEIRRLKEKFAKEVEKIQPRLPVFVPISSPSNLEKEQSKIIRIQYRKPVFPVIQHTQQNIERKQSEELAPSSMIKNIQTKSLVTPKQIQSQPQKVYPKPTETTKYIQVEAPKVLPLVQPGEINLGKIIMITKDPLITYIEAPGEDKNVIIRKIGHTYTTQIKLTRAEILDVIKSFSEITRIPLIEGMLIARHGDLEISAVVSETISPSFIIKKDIIPSVKPMASQLVQPQPYVSSKPRTEINFRQISAQQNPIKEKEKEESFWNRKITFGKE